MQVGLSRAYVSVALAGLVSLAAGCSPPGTGIDDCADGIDNDGDGLIDSGDPGCRLNGQSEEPDPVACNDGIDNDNDGLIDFGADPGCLAGTDEDEYDQLRPECSDSIDNDGDGLTDYPFDPGCFLALEDGEEDDCPDGPGCPQCANGMDDDGDGLTDVGEDPGCEHAGDADEFDLNANACGGDLSVSPFPDSNQAVGNAVVGGQSALDSPVCGGGGYEYAYAVRIREPTTLLISTDFFQTTVDTVIYFRKDCLDPSTEMGCNDNRAADAVSSELLIDVDEPGVYYLIVDVANLGVTGGFKVGITYYSHRGDPCDVANPTCAPGDSCRPLDDTTTETTCLPPVCIDEHDNDGDGLADFPWDPGCTDAGDTTEDDDCPGGPGCPECGNGMDDDGDGAVDYPADIGCYGAGDDVEENCPDESDPLVVLTGAVTTSSTVGAANDFVPACGSSSHTAPDRVFVLPVLGALRSLTADTVGSSFDTTLTVRAMDCNAADTACNDDAVGSQSRVTLSGVAAGQYYLIVDGFSSGSGSVTLTVRGTIENGQACDPALEASGLLTCGDGYACVGGTCAPAQCADGSDDDGDGLIDFPADPGCTSSSDNTEMDECPSGPTCPACSNDLDDDGDGVIDYPLDPGCQAAGDTNEDDCSTETDGVVTLTDRVTLATTVNATNDFAPSCVTGSTARDMTFRLSAPGNLLSLDANTFGSSFNTVLSVKAPSCASAPDLTCNNDSASNTQSQIALSNLSAGDYYFVVDGTDTASGAVSLEVRGVLAAGESCNAAQEASGLIVCQSGFACVGGTCAQALCNNGMDDDGDGNSDYPDDPGCAMPSDVDEQDDCPMGPSCPQCSNGSDDDGDGLIDYGMDPGCQAAGDALEIDECIAGVNVTPLTDAGASGVTPATGPSSFQGTCNGSATSTEVVYAYQLDRILSSITFSTVGSAGDTVTYVRYQMCGDPLAELGCGNVQNGGEAITVANPSPGSYFVFVDGDFVSGISYVLGVSGTIPGGDACDPASSQFVCEPGFACDAMSLTCVAAVCNNNLDDDGDGATDYPNDPGCTSISDSDEADDCPAGMSCPLCSNAIDDDGDGSIDFPADLSCSAASDGSEADCTQELDPVTTLTMTPVTGTTVGASSDLGQSCGGSSTPEVTFEVYFPGMLSSLTVDTFGSTYDTLLGIRAGSCGGSSIGCNDDFGSNPHSQVVLTDLAAGSYFIHVDGYNSNSGDFTLNVSGIVASGQTCDPAQIAANIVSCAAGTACTDPGTGFLCQ